MLNSDEQDSAVSKYEELSWQELEEPKKDDVVREAKRYCPEFPFEPALVEQASNLKPFYTEDYQLVRLSSSRSGDRKEVWGFYALGDFHPLDGSGRVFEALNQIAPLNLNRDTVLDYALTRLRLELPQRFNTTKESSAFRCAEIVSNDDEVPSEAIARLPKGIQLTGPRVVVVADPERGQAPAEHGTVFRVIAIAKVYVSQTEWELVQALVQIEPDGELSLSRIESEQKIGSGTRSSTVPPVAEILMPLRTRTASPIKEWLTLTGSDRERIFSEFVKRGISIPPTEDESDLTGSKQKEAQARIILRIAKLPFYRERKLLEVLLANETGYRRSYALIRIETDELDIEPLDGNARVVHLTNRWEELSLTPDVVNDYLRFFCWAMHKNGPFHLPSSLREIPLLVATKAQIEALRQFDFRISDEDDLRQAPHDSKTTASKHIRKRLVVYESGLFEAKFAIDREGQVEMLEDQPLVSDLKIYIEKYTDDSGDLFKLRTAEEQGPSTVYLSLVNRVILHTELRTLLSSWERLTPNDQTIPLSDAPEVKQSLKRILKQLSEEIIASNEALNFLMAQLKQSKEALTIAPATFVNRLTKFIKGLRPPFATSAEGLHHRLARELGAEWFDVDDEVIFDRMSSIEPDNENPSSKTRPHFEHRISKCWFKKVVRLLNLPDTHFVFDHCVFEEGLIAEGGQIGKELIFRDCVFQSSPLDFKSSFFESQAINLKNAIISAPLLLERCQLAGTFYAPGLRAKANVQLDACGIAANLATINEPRTVDWMLSRPWPAPEGEFDPASLPLFEAINLVAARIEGSLIVGGSSNASMVYGGINASEIVVGKTVGFGGTSCEKGVSFSSAKINSYVSCSAMRILNGALEFRKATIVGGVGLRRARVNGEVSLYLATVEGNVDLLGLKITGNLNLMLGEFRAFVAAYHTVDDSGFSSLSVGGALLLSGAHARIVELRGAEITGNIEIITGQFGRLILGLGAIPVGTGGDETSRNTQAQFVVKPCSAQAVMISGIAVEETLNLSGVNVRLPADDRDSNLLRADLQGIAIGITNSRIGRDLTFFTERIRFELERRSRGKPHRVQWQSTPSAADCRVSAWGNLDLKANEIKGSLDLRNMNVQGDIDLNHSNIRVDVNIDAGDPDFEGLTTECKNLITEKLECFGDLKLSGIKILESLRARQAIVRGEIAFVRKQPQRVGQSGNLNRDQNAGVTIEGDLDLSAVEVSGDLDLRNLKVGGEIQMNDASVGNVNLGGAQCKNLRAEKLDCQGDLRLSAMVVSQNLIARQAKINGQISISSMDKESPTLISGKLDLCSVEVSGGLELKHLRVSGEILINDATVRRDLEVVETECKELSAEKLDCSGDLKLSAIHVSETLRLRQGKTKGGLSISSALATHPLIANEITGDLDLCSMQVNGSLELHDLNVGGNILVDDTSVSRNFDVFQSKCRSLHAEKIDCLGDVRLSALIVNNNLRARQAKVKGEFLCVLVAPDAPTTGETSDRKHLAKISGDLDLISLEVSGSLDLRNFDVTGDILVSDGSVGRDFNIDVRSFSGEPTLCNNLNAEGLKCNGELKLSGLHAKGDFRGRDIQVGGDITFLETISIKNANGNGQLQHARIGGSIDLTAVKANRLSVSGINLCDELRLQDLNLSKLLTQLQTSNDELPLFLKGKIKGATLERLNNGGQEAELQELILTDLNELIGGSSLFERRRFAKVDLSPGFRRHLNELDQLAPIDIKRLNRRLLEDSYPINPQSTSRVILERSQIGHLEITKPPVLGKVNLSGTSVTHWLFLNINKKNGGDPATNGNAGSETVNPDDYIELLNESFPFNRSMWIDVEKYLRNQSLVAEANRVYREMRRRVKTDAEAGPILDACSKATNWVRHKTPEPLVRRWNRATTWISKKHYHLIQPMLWHVWDRLQYASIGYSTRVWIPMIPALVLFVISLFVFQQQQYVRASPGLLQVLQPKAEASPSPAPPEVALERRPNSIPNVHWGWGDSMALTLRYHVPILTSLTHNWWEASGQPIVGSFTAERYAFFVQVYHWIAWPLFLLGAAAQVFRGKQD